jgi:ribose-phosphate pyrophosphokinase
MLGDLSLWTLIQINVSFLCELAVHLEQSVRNCEVFIVQPTSPPVNEHLVELLTLSDTCRRAAAARITAVVPYFGYARCDKRHGRREHITASMVALLLQAVGVNHIVTVDFHAQQIEGFFHIPIECASSACLINRNWRWAPSRAVASGC